MRIFGIVISFKRESRWVPRQEFNELSAAVQELSEVVKSVYNGVEAGRKRLERHIGKGDGKEEIISEVKNEPARPLNPGDILTPEEIARLEVN